MSGTWRTFATMAVGGFIGLAVGFAATLGAAPADVRDAAPIVSNRAAKHDRLATATMTGDSLPQPVVVSQVRLPGPNGPVVALTDAEGRIFHRSDPLAGETVVAGGTLVPALAPRVEPGPDSRHRVMTAWGAVRAAKADPEGFLTAVVRREH